MIERMNIVVSTDGACSGNPGPGGYACVLRFGEHVREIAGYEPHTTNNRMELQAVIEAVKVLRKPCDITFRTDSEYVINGMVNAKERCANGWRTKSGARCKNSDQWQLLVDLGKAGNHKFHYQKVQGHSGDADNERCDFLAKSQISANK